MPRNTLILNIVCDRVIYFTQDETYKPLPSPYTWVAYYDGELPKAMTLGNCWGWRFRNNELYYADEYTPKERGLPYDQVLLTRNKTALKGEAETKLDLLAKPHLAGSKLSEALRALKLRLAQEAVSGSISPELEALAAAQQMAPLDYAQDVLIAAKLNDAALLKLELQRAALLAEIEQITTNQQVEAFRRKLNDLRN